MDRIYGLSEFVITTVRAIPATDGMCGQVCEGTRFVK